MDIVYVVGKGSRVNNLELRMSLRSICRFGRNVGKVIVVGAPPKWVSDAAIKVDVEDKYPYKHSNIMICLERLVDMGIVKGEFLYSSDDHFYVKVSDFANYPYYIKSERLRESVRRNDDFYKYHKSLVDTRLFLERHGFPAKNYSQHCNTHMVSTVFSDYKTLLHETYKLTYGVEPTSFVMNIWSTLPNAPTAVPRNDVKICRAQTVEDIKEQIGSRECFSIGDAVFKSRAIREFFSSTYPRKCVFEAD